MGDSSSLVAGERPIELNDGVAAVLFCGYEAEVISYVLKTQGCKQCANRAKEKWTATTEERNGNGRVSA
jgi:hypothetical protein